MSEAVRLSYKVNRILEIVDDLRSQGYRQGIDFDFSYFPYQYDQFTGDETLAYTEFLFYNTALSSWFALKYS